MLKKSPITIGGISGYKVTYDNRIFAAGDSSTVVYIYQGLIIKDNNEVVSKVKI